MTILTRHVSSVLALLHRVFPSRPPTSISIIVIFDYHYTGEEDDWSIDGGNSSGELGGVGDLDYQSIGQLETDFLDKQHDFSEHAELNSNNTLIGKNPWSLLITVEHDFNGHEVNVSNTWG